MRRIVREQDRKILDAVVPEELACSAMKLLTQRFQLKDGYLYPCKEGEVPADGFGALDVYRRFGGTTMEDALKKVLAKIVYV